MRKFGDLLKDLGFNPESPLETQKAFFRHLVRAADQTSKEISDSVRPISIPPQEPTQLSFDPDILKIQTKF